MEEKRTRYISRVLILNDINRKLSLFAWDEDAFNNLVADEEKHYGLKLLSMPNRIKITVEYTNIIWEYKFYLGTYKKKYKPLTPDDIRWDMVQKYIVEDLHFMGADQLFEMILDALKENKELEYKITQKIQFKNYCI